ncbi:MAG: DUF2252 family protein [Methylovulum sp.]|uniref:DUF2252 domain-containing protein n=1 Tax=Methylovulum sp. TaxID=1916980 RepID=UPI0026333C0F|nr:DUF2252 family protein [Methylovulum sp.]MDD2722694.1 DUF2252 family protein [Methylovulum sp.]MDD5124233.1 DUF2252 family protein [Methylovulum sp.]
MKLRNFFAVGLAVSALSSALAPSQAEAATSRKTWLVQKIYNYNHPFAANLSTELAVKMTKMAVNAFAFYRGTAHIFYEDTKNTATWPTSWYTNTITNGVWLEGDMHMQNMGGFRDANSNAVFDTNDFDEGYWGSYTWDLRRMAVAILLAGEEKGISSTNRQTLVKNFVGSYATQIAAFKGNDNELSYRLGASNTNGIVKDTIQAADGKTRSSLLAKYTAVSGGSRYFLTISGSLQPVNSATFTAINAAMLGYISSISASKRKSNSYYVLKAAASRLGSGTGSLGRYRYYLLIDGPSTATSDDVILEMKQETDSAVSIAAPGNMPAWTYDYHNGERVTKSIKAMLTNTDVLVGYTNLNALPFFISERLPYQEDFDYTLLTTYTKFNDAVNYMGKILAKNHALADKDYDATLIPYSMDKEITDVINGDVSGLKTEILNYALSYAAQVKQDYADFVSAKNSGSVLY